MTKLMKRTMKLTAISMVLVLALSSCALAVPNNGPDGGKQPQGTRVMSQENTQREMDKKSESKQDSTRAIQRESMQKRESVKTMQHEPVQKHEPAKAIQHKPVQKHEPARPIQHKPMPKREPARPKPKHQRPRHHTSNYDLEKTQTVVAAGVIGLAIGSAIANSSCN